MTRKNPYDALKREQEREKQLLAPEKGDAGKKAREEDSLQEAPPAEASQEQAPRDEAAAPQACPLCKAAEEEAARARAEAVDTRLRALADMDNTRKRLLREKEEAIRYASSQVLADIIPALDNFDLALGHGQGNEGCRDVLLGVEMTRKLLLDALKRHGLEQVGAVGEVFDPLFHEAIGMVDCPDQPEGTICSLLTRGYRLHERLLRPARVMVCKR
jgi:molecular chaperone GrpE